MSSSLSGETPSGKTATKRLLKELDAWRREQGGREKGIERLGPAWTPAYSVLECVRALRFLLACPEVDSPLNVDVAALLRQGDVLGARRLVECWALDDEDFSFALAFFSYTHHPKLLIVRRQLDTWRNRHVFHSSSA
ncbi:hypothetical protein L249_4216 [Ophiocordyceps polyrhachis-furcata BCC 54312]|uniref:UBC core domain-containing protein n=1 Tax=Ophiocordyceps polyrhachis-furcata BCC 54312 TaxID=1330021 RepID=A0A367LBS2_9HYPO|nr:hypothetical protein L249_4216 [Ophiocordyceps polyrhachis-furcata BCC 54312]